ncbi:phosphopantetheine-binding protein [Azospirillum argentinense]
MHDGELDRGRIEHRLLTLIREAKGADLPLGNEPDRRLVEDFGLDSMGLVSLHIWIAEEFQLPSVEESVYAGLRTFDDLVRFVIDMRTAGS